MNPDLKVGDTLDVDGHGVGVVTGFQGRIEGQQERLYVAVKFTPGRGALVPVVML